MIFPVFRSHNFTSSVSVETLTNKEVSSKIVRELMALLCPSKVFKHLPLFVSHTLILLSQLPLKSSDEFNMTKDWTQFECPLNNFTHLSVSKSQSRIVLSNEPLKSSFFSERDKHET